MDWAVSRQSVTAETRVRSRAGRGEICGGESGSGTGFSPRASYNCVLTDKRAKPGNL